MESQRQSGQNAVIRGSKFNQWLVPGDTPLLATLGLHSLTMDSLDKGMEYSLHLVGECQTEGNP